MTSAAPSPRLARAASRVVAGTLGAAGQTLRRAGRSPFSAPPCPGRPDQVAAIGFLVPIAAFPADAAFIAPLSRRVGGHPSFSAGTQC